MDKLARNSLFSNIISRNNKDSATVPLGQGCILVVDDSRTQVYALKKVLTEAGYEVLTASNGEDGVNVAIRMQPDLILMDIVMPGMNGFQATRSLSATAETKHIPVIIISGSDQASDRVWGARAGASDFIAKPIGRSQLLAKVTYFRRKQMRDSLEQGSTSIQELPFD